MRKQDFPVTFSAEEIRQYRRDLGVKLLTAGSMFTVFQFY